MRGAKGEQPSANDDKAAMIQREYELTEALKKKTEESKQKQAINALNAEYKVEKLAQLERQANGTPLLVVGTQAFEGQWVSLKQPLALHDAIDSPSHRQQRIRDA